MWMTSLLVMLAAYLWGSLSPASVVARSLKGVDLRRYGSGNIGSSNVGEAIGHPWTIAVGLLDLVKGFLPLFVLRAGGIDLPILVFASVATVIGHNWSFYLGFTGGRGMATAIGILLAWDVRLAMLLLVALAGGWLTKQSAPGAMLGLLLLAPEAWVLGDKPGVVMCAMLTLTIVVKRLEANRLPLPPNLREIRVVLLRRFWMDRDVPPDQPWQDRQRIDGQ